jgi:hypothetical protein
MTKLLVLRTHLDASQVLRTEGEVYDEPEAAYAKIREELGIVTTDIPKTAKAAKAAAEAEAAKPDAKPDADAPAAPTPFD